MLAGLILWALLTPGAVWAGDSDGLSLKDCLKIAQERHPGLRSAEFAVASQLSLVTQAQSAHYPQIAVAATANRTQDENLNSGELLERTDSYSPMNVTGQMLFYDFGRTRGTVAASRRDVVTAQENLHLKEAQVVLEVKTAYHEVLRTASALSMTEASLQMRRKLLSLIAHAYQRGTRSKFDVSRAETDLESTRLDLVSAISRLETARKRLLTAMGTPAAQWRKLSGALEEHKIALDDPTVMQLTLRLRPEILAGRARMESAEFKRRVALDQYLPTINFNGGYTLNRQLSPLPAAINTWQIGATASLNLFDGFNTPAGYRGAVARWESARQDLAEVQQNVEFELNAALIALREAQQRIDGSHKLLRSAEESLDLAVGQFEKGRGGIFDLIDAQNQALRARLNLNDSLADTLNAEASLEKAVGAALEDMPRRQR